MREKILFDSNWDFHKGDIESTLVTQKKIVYCEAKTECALRGPASRNYNTSHDASENWTLVDLPHDYVIYETPKADGNEGLGFYTYDNAWYRKRFVLPQEDKGKRITLLFEGVATHATVYVNGCLLKRNFSRYTEFEVDISDVVEFGKENTVAIYVNTEANEGWWYAGGGIYRHVWLVKTHSVSVDLYGIYVKPQKIDENKWNIFSEITLRNDFFEEKKVKVVCSVSDNMGNIVSQGSAEGVIFCNDRKVLNIDMNVENPALWSPDSPNLYTMTTKVFLDEQEVDEEFTRFGFRTIRIDVKKGLFINDNHYKIKGLCGHADCGLMGKAVPDNIHRYKVDLMREMGANGYRTSHYPQSSVLMDALDEAGFIVMDEARWFQSSDESLSQLEMLIKRDRNRPSVVFWSIGNEEMFHENERGKRIAQKMYNFVKKLDNTRPVMTCVNVAHDKLTVGENLDVIGINYNWETFEPMHELYPDKPIMSSENCATGTTRGWYFENQTEKAFINAYDHDTNSLFVSREKVWKFIAERDWIIGGYQWIAFEHRGEAAWPRLCSQSGAVDLFMQKKDAFWQNKSHWTNEPMVHLLPHWNWSGFEGEKIKVWAYTNVNELELFLNGKSLGKREVEKYGHAEWDVEFKSGKLEVIAYDGENIVARDERITSETASRLMLKLDTEDVMANGRDIALFTCYAVDKDGNEVYDATPTVTFSTNNLGQIYSTGSDITDHSSIFLSTRKMRSGRISVAVKLGTKAGELKLYAQSANLKSAVLTVDIKNEI